MVLRKYRRQYLDFRYQHVDLTRATRYSEIYRKLQEALFQMLMCLTWIDEACNLQD